MANGSPITLKAPKQEFQDITNAIRQHREMVDSDAFRRGTQYALLQYNALMTDRLDPTQAGAIGMKLAGAREFLSVLITLAETPHVQAPTIVTPANLDHGRS